MDFYSTVKSRLFNHQEHAFWELYTRANAYFAGWWKPFPIKSRWHSLVAGPSGTGKTAIASLLAEATNAKLLRVSAPEWMPAGAHNRALGETLPIIADHVSKNRRSVVFLDEIDKIYHETPWCAYIRGEIYELLDGRWPIGIAKKEDDDEDAHPDAQDLDANKLRYKTFFLAAGTFQSFFDQNSSARTSIGFHSDSRAETKQFSSEAMAEKLPRELKNRFDSQIILIPELKDQDYEILAQRAENSLPDWIRGAFREAVAKRLPRAIKAKSGCRFVEEALADAIKFLPVMDQPEGPQL